MVVLVVVLPSHLHLVLVVAGAPALQAAASLLPTVLTTPTAPHAQQSVVCCLMLQQQTGTRHGVAGCTSLSAAAAQHLQHTHTRMQQEHCHWATMAAVAVGQLIQPQQQWEEQGALSMVP